MEEIYVEMDLGDVKEARERGFIDRKGVRFCLSTIASGNMDRDRFKRVVVMSPSTFYRNGEAEWRTTDILGNHASDVYVHVDFERPSLMEMIEAEIEYLDDWFERAERTEQKEWISGQLYQLETIRNWLRDTKELSE